MDSPDPTIDCLQSIDLSLAGVPRRVEQCLSVTKWDYQQEFSSILLAAQERGVSLADDRWWLLVAFVFGNSSPAVGEAVLRAAASAYSAQPTTFLGEALVRVLEYCWFDAADPDAVEYHYWACGQLAARYSDHAEGLILDRLAIQRNPLKRRSLILAVGVLAHAPLLHCLQTSTTAVVMRILSDDGEPSLVRDAAKEVLLEDILRADREQAFLLPTQRQEIEMLTGSGDA